MAKCKACGQRIVWGHLPDMSKVPLDPKPAVYLVIADGRAFKDTGGKITGKWMVVHSATCKPAPKTEAQNVVA